MGRAGKDHCDFLHAAAEERGVGRSLLEEVVEHLDALHGAQLAVSHNLCSAICATISLQRIEPDNTGGVRGRLSEIVIGQEGRRRVWTTNGRRKSQDQCRERSTLPARLPTPQTPQSHPQHIPPSLSRKSRVFRDVAVCLCLPPLPPCASPLDSRRNFKGLGRGRGVRSTKGGGGGQSCRPKGGKPVLIGCFRKFSACQFSTEIRSKTLQHQLKSVGRNCGGGGSL